MKRADNSVSSMYRLKRSVFVLAVGFTTLASPLLAHAPYERLWATVTAPDGRQLAIIARYTDGIIAADPVTVSVRESNGVVIGETDPARDAIVRCPSFESCLVFLYEPPFGLFPRAVLRLTPTGLVREPANRYRIVGAFLPLRHHVAELLILSVWLAIVPLLAQALARRPFTWTTVVFWCLFVPAWLWLCLFVILLNVKVSVTWIAISAGCLAVTPAALRAIAQRRLVAV